MAKQDISQNKKTAESQYVYPKMTKYSWLLAALAFVLSFIIYGNTIYHDYALDDLVSITQNAHTLKGYAGIKDLLTKDSFNGYTQYANLVSGGRYRPLALVTFAIEIGIWGKNIPHISHFGNVLFFAISMFLLFIVCYRYIFKGKLLASAFTCLIFIIHPLHTEVVANIKSRDEIFSLLFSLGAMYFLFEYLRDKKNWIFLALSGITFFLAVLSKENAVLFIVFIPLVLYYFYNDSLIKAIKETWFILLVTFIFIAIRFSITGFHSNPQNEILNSPYLWAKPGEAFATKIYILLRHLGLIFYPYPLSCLYTWNAIPYIQIIDYKFLIAFTVYAIIIYYGIKGFFKRNPLSFFILNYLAMLSLVSNLLFDIGALMGDRFLYQAGFPVILAGGYYLDLLLEKYKSKQVRIVVISFLVILVTFYTYRTTKRNAAWTNDDTIAIEDKDTYECAHVKINTASAYIRLCLKETDKRKKDSLFTLSQEYFHKGLKIYPTYVDGHIIAGSCFYLAGFLDSATVYYDKAYQLSPENLTLKNYFPIIGKDYYNRAQQQLARKQTDSAAFSFKMAMKHDTLYVQLIRFFYDRAFDSYMNKDFAKAIYYLDSYLEFKRDNVQVYLLYGDITFLSRQYDKARTLYQTALKMQPNNMAVIKQLQNIELLSPKTQKDSVASTNILKL